MTGEVIRKGIEERIEKKEGKERDWKMQTSTVMTPERTETGGGIKRKSMRGKEIRKGTGIKRRIGIGMDKDTARSTGVKGENMETRKEGEKNGTENTGLRGREGDMKRVEKVKDIG